MIGNIIDVFFFALCAIVFGTIIWYNITETSKAKKRLKDHKRSH